MSAKDEKSKTHYNYHPVKLLGIFFIWTISIYIALVLIKNYDTDLPSESAEFSRPPIVKNENICQSPECITLAHQLHNWQDISADPCQDFYQAACGKYNEHSATNENRVKKTSMIMENLVTEHLVKNLPTTSKSEQAMQVFYQKCKMSKKLNETEKDNERLIAVFQTVKRIGPWPMVDKHWNESEFDLNDMISNMASLGKTNFGFFAIEPTEDSNIKISLTNVFVQYAEFTSSLLDGGFDKFFGDLLKSNNVTVDGNIISEDFELLSKFITRTLEIHKLSGETVEFSEIQKKVPSINFERIIKSLLKPETKEETWKKIVDKLVGEKQEYFFGEKYNLEKVLSNTSKREQANLVIYFFLLSEASKWGSEKKNDCAQRTTKTFPLAALRIFVRNHFDKENLEIASKMVEDIRNSFIEMIQESTWLNETTKKNAIRKAEMMRKMVGYPKELETPGALDSFFETFHLSSNDTFYDLVNTVERFKTQQAIGFVSSSLTMQSSESHFSASAFYDPIRNHLTMNVPFIDDPLFDSTYPSYAKIAMIGEVLGHEIGHGFDPYGRKFDENGKPNDWWTQEDSAEYDRKAQCLIDRYNNFDDIHFGKNLNGSITNGEMSADLIGLNLSWRTYKKLDLTNEPKIIGFEDYNTDKLFFRMTALNFCSGRSKTPLSNQLKETHPTDNFRVNGIFSNIEQFAEAYNCPVGSPMNPVKKCELF